MNTDRPSWFAGADIGGTKAEFVFRTDASRDGTVVRLDGINLTVSGADAAAHLIKEAVSTIRAKEALDGSGALVLGIAGGGDPRRKSRLESILRDRIPDCRTTVMSDAEIALYGAFGDSSGVLIIAGTGSVVFVRDLDGNLTTAGGHGPLLGDPGSGTNLGRCALAAIANSLDGGPDTSLNRRVEPCHAPHGIRAWLQDPAIVVARLAPLVLEAAQDQDEVAIRIVSREIRALSKQASWAVDAARAAVEPRIALVGGLTNNPFYRDLLQVVLIERLPGFRFVDAVMAPSFAALSLAERHRIDKR